MTCAQIYFHYLVASKPLTVILQCGAFPNPYTCATSVKQLFINRLANSLHIVWKGMCFPLILVCTCIELILGPVFSPPFSKVLIHTGPQSQAHSHPMIFHFSECFPFISLILAIAGSQGTTESNRSYPLLAWFHKGNLSVKSLKISNHDLIFLSASPSQFLTRVIAFLWIKFSQLCKDL